MKKSSQKSSSFFYKRVLYKILILIDIFNRIIKILLNIAILIKYLKAKFK